MAALTLAFELMIMISIGIFARRSGMIGKDFGSSLTRFMLNITLPCMIIQSLQIPFSHEQLRTCGLLFALSMGLLILYFTLGQLMYTILGKGSRGRTFRFGTMFTNFTFMGLPAIESLYGQEGLFLFVIFVIPFRLAYYSSAKPLLTPPELKYRSHTVLATLRGFFSPPVAAALTGLLLYATQLPLPGPVSHIMETVGGMSSPLGMILCGISLAEFRGKEFRSPRYLAFPLFRNLLVPALTATLLLLLPIDPLIKKILTVFAALPVASLLAAFTMEYDPDPESQKESAGSVFFSTLLSALTVPLWAYFAELLF